MKQKFLIIEDDYSSRYLLELLIYRYFEAAEVHSFSGADEVVRKTGEQIAYFFMRFDVIITDIFLSGDLTGIDLAKNLSPELRKKTIICSSTEPDKFYQLSQEQGFKCAYIQKPYDDLQMLKLLQEMGLKRKVMATGAPAVKKVELETSGPVILVTGCSSGVGEVLARKLIDIPEYKIVITARQRSIEKVREKFSESDRVMILPLDVSVDQQMTDVVEQVVKRWGRLDVLINNAGICFRTVVEQMDRESEMDQLQVNYLGPMTLSRLVIPFMRERGRGKIINVSSVSGILGMPTMASYSASKHALEGASESLWYELKPMGINVCVVRPGFINSDGYTHVKLAPKGSLSEKLNGPYADFYQFMSPFVSRLMRSSMDTSESVANKILQMIQMQNPPLWVNATPDAFMFSLLRQICPECFFHKLINKIFRLQINWGSGYSRANPKRL